jgi:Kef-type K+ transport system membrane component KefB/nucleotide-binding universal stress UspA family protein
MSWLMHDPMTRLLVQIVAIIATARGIGLVMRRLGQPSVVAEIAAGIVLGPSVLGWAAPDVFDGLFPVGSLGVVRMLSQIGLILFMFLVGLELDFSVLRGRIRSSVAISLTSIVVPFALGCGVALWLRERYLAPEVPFVAFALFMGAAMSITAFPVLARILSERRLLRTRVGTITIACAAVDDVTAWCLLAFVVAAAQTNDVAGAIVTTVLAFAYLGAMLLAVRPLLRRVSTRVSTPGAMSQNIVALVVVLVLVSSWITERIGIHLLFGAFVFGAVFPKEGGFARALAEKLEDMVVVVLLPLFFAVSGLRTEVGLVTTGDHVMVFAVIVAVACIGKFGGGTVAARLSGLSWRESSALGILMNTRGLMELIVLNIGLDLGVISPTIFSMMVLMALATTVATTPLLEAIYPASVMARDLLEDHRPMPKPPTSSTYRVLVCVSHGESGPALVTIASALAARDQDETTLLHIAAADERTSRRVALDGIEEREALAPALETARALGVPARPLSFVSAEPADDIVRIANVREMDLVLLGLHKPVLSQTLLGGVVRDVLQRTRASVAVHVPRRDGEVGRVLVPFQGAPEDLAALAVAARIERIRGARITVLHVVSPDGMSGEARAAIEKFQAEGGRVSIETAGHRSPAEAAVRCAAEHDLVIVGVGPEWGLGARRIGLQPEQMIRDCPASLLVVRGPRVDSKHGRRGLATARIASQASEDR